MTDPDTQGMGLACGYCGQTYALPHECPAWSDIRALEAKVTRLQERDDTWRGIVRRLLDGETPTSENYWWRPVYDEHGGLNEPTEPMSEAEVQLLRGGQ